MYSFTAQSIAICLLATQFCIQFATWKKKLIIIVELHGHTEFELYSGVSIIIIILIILEIDSIKKKEN